MNESSENSGTNELEALDYLRGVKSSTCLLLPTTPSPTPLDFKHPLSEEMSDRPFLALNDDPNMVNVQAGKHFNIQPFFQYYRSYDTYFKYVISFLRMSRR